MSDRIRPIILAGGAGTRLWPLSSRTRPKHMLPLIGERTLLEQTLQRVSDRAIFDRPLIVCAPSQAHATEAAAGGARLIVEPVARNSAPAIGLAALAGEPDDLLLVLPSDHYILDPAPLLDAVRRARPIAEAGRIVTFGIAPAFPETGYGYVAAGPALSDHVFEAARFIEKPDRPTAERLIAEGSNYWNAGIFLFKASVLLDELERHAPEISRAIRDSMASATDEGERIHPGSQALEHCPLLSIDYAVMEKSDRVAVAPVDMHWSDLGTWAAIHDAAPKDEDGNAVDERSTVLGSHGCIIRSDGPRVTAIGVEDLVIVATADHVLVVPRSEAQRVREAAELAQSKAKS